MIVTAMDTRNIAILMDQGHATVLCEAVSLLTKEITAMIAVSESPKVRETLPTYTADDVLAALLDFHSIMSYHLNAMQEAIRIMAARTGQPQAAPELDSNIPSGPVN